MAGSRVVDLVHIRESASLKLGTSYMYLITCKVDRCIIALSAAQTLLCIVVRAHAMVFGMNTAAVQRHTLHVLALALEYSLLAVLQR